MTTYNDASEEDKEAHVLIRGALAGFMEVATRKSEEWRARGLPVPDAEWWYMMLALHVIEALRQQSGGAVRADDFKTLAMIIDEAARGTELIVVGGKRATHEGTGRLQ